MGLHAAVAVAVACTAISMLQTQGLVAWRLELGAPQTDNFCVSVMSCTQDGWLPSDDAASAAQARGFMLLHGV